MRYGLIGLAIAAILAVQSPHRSEAAEIPLGTSGGIYTVPVQVNGAVTMDFLVDPGAGVVVIPLSAMRELIASGTLQRSDIIGIGTAELADSSVYLTARVRLRELRVGGIVARDVTAAVSPGLSAPLLGQSFLRRFSSVTFDNRRNVMILSDDRSPAVADAQVPAWVAPYPSYQQPTAPLSGGGYGYYTYGSSSGR